MFRLRMKIITLTHQKFTKLKRPNKKIVILLIGLLGLIKISTAQFDLFSGIKSFDNPFVFSDNKNEELKQYEEELSSKLRKYIDRDKFLVIVDLKETTLSKTKKDRSINVDTGISIDQLPGLPFHPSIRKQVNVNVPTSLNNTYKHVVSVLLDTSLDQGTLDFVDRLLLGTGLIDESKGDELNIEFMEFPNNKGKWSISRGLDKPENKINDESLNPEESFLKKFENIIDKKLGNVGDKKATEDEHNNTFQWIFIILFIVIIILIAYMFFSNKKSSSEIKEVLQNKDNSKFDTIQNSIESLKTSLNEPVKPSPSVSNDTDDNAKTQNGNELKSDMSNLFVDDLETTIEYIKHTLGENDDDQINNIAMAISVTNPSIMSFIKPLLSEEEYYRLDATLFNIKYKSNAEKMGALSRFREAYIKFRTRNFQKTKVDKNKDIFQFLKQLNNNQIIQLIKDESEDMTAILLAQLPADQCVEVLGKFEIAKQTILLQRMSNISNIPTNIYKEVATRFSKKAVILSDMGNVAIDGLNSIIKILETLPSKKQEAYIEDISKYDLDLARRIKEHFLTFEGLLDIDSAILSKSLEEITSSEIGIALTGASTTLLNKILDTKTNREQELIKSEMQINQNVSESEIETMRKKIITVVQDKIKR